MDENRSVEGAAVASRSRAERIVDVVAAPEAERLVQGPERGNDLALDEDAEEDQKGHLVDQAEVLFLERGRPGVQLNGRGVGRERFDVQAGGRVAHPSGKDSVQLQVEITWQLLHINLCTIDASRRHIKRIGVFAEFH